MTAHMLPEEFSDLEPYAGTWCLASEPERWERRQSSSLEEMQAFYDAVFPRAEEAMQYCDRFPLDEMPAGALHLFEMLLSLALVSYAVEVWGQQQPVDVGAATMERTADPRP
jgi:hypothetical protein